ncbi:DUF1836 domain-containing protein [Faecalimonas umbilicata]|uniref:DUF1836 domain-containing protein n=1 Tax=Faecalimonas umbilicata TaxID=1912855 RepID=UPI002A81E6B4|nr:DUF1836 domain-containing protein [Faecalimonas umbilicata]MDY4597310.1 DUF1836 domain-containing protein [Faecalimonas umbilicata]
MTINTEDILNSILESISRIDYVKADEIPNIDLYMDQVTTFMNDHMKSSKRYEDDKILTKTMINNYAKNELLPPPLKKKYSKEHVMVLIFIYYFKNILSIKDIETLLKPITENYFHTDKELSFTDLYEEVCSLEKSRIDHLKKDITEIYRTSSETFSDADEENREFLRLFSFICTLSFDVYVKKQLIEKLVDALPPSDNRKHKK